MTEHNASTWLLDRHVAGGRGGRTAYRVDGKSTTYEALQRQVWRAQNALRSLDIRRGERVALVLDDELAYPTWLTRRRSGSTAPAPPVSRRG
jgi:4-hydroxybenzoate-CoA ligase